MRRKKNNNVETHARIDVQAQIIWMTRFYQFGLLWRKRTLSNETLGKIGFNGGNTEGISV